MVAKDIHSRVPAMAKERVPVRRSSATRLLNTVQFTAKVTANHVHDEERTASHTLFKGSDSNGQRFTPKSPQLDPKLCFCLRASGSILHRPACSHQVQRDSCPSVLQVRKQEIHASANIQRSPRAVLINLCEPPALGT